MPPIDHALPAAARRRAHAVLFNRNATPEAAYAAAVVCERSWWLDRDLRDGRTPTWRPLVDAQERLTLAAGGAR